MVITFVAQSTMPLYWDPSCSRLLIRSKGSDRKAAKKPPLAAAPRRVTRPGLLGSSPVILSTISLAWSLHAIIPTFIDIPLNMFGPSPL